MCVNSPGVNVIYSAETTSGTVNRFGIFFNETDFSCTGAVLFNRTLTLPNTCASLSATQPLGGFTIYSYDSKLGFNTSCARPVYQVGRIDGVCYPDGNISTMFRVCDQSSGYGFFTAYFTSSKCIGPNVIGKTPVGQFCSQLPDSSSYINECYSPSTALSTVSPTYNNQPTEDKVHCYEALLTEYQLANSYEVGSGTGIASIEAFTSSSEIRVNATFSRLLFPTNEYEIRLQVPTLSTVRELLLSKPVPYNVTSGFYSYTTSVTRDFIPDLAYATEKPIFALGTSLGLLYGQFSPCSGVATTSFTPARARAQRVKYLRDV